MEASDSDDSSSSSSPGEEVPPPPPPPLPPPPPPPLPLQATTPEVQTHYEVLKVDPRDPQEVVISTPKNLLRVHHQDKVGSVTDFARKVQEAMNALRTPDLRRKYDIEVMGGLALGLPPVNDHYLHIVEGFMMRELATCPESVREERERSLRDYLDALGRARNRGKDFQVSTARAHGRLPPPDGLVLILNDEALKRRRDPKHASLWLHLLSMAKRMVHVQLLPDRLVLQGLPQAIWVVDDMQKIFMAWKAKVLAPWTEEHAPQERPAYNFAFEIQQFATDPDHAGHLQAVMPDPAAQFKAQYCAVTALTPDVEPSKDDLVSMLGDKPLSQMLTKMQAVKRACAAGEDTPQVRGSLVPVVMKLLSSPPVRALLHELAAEERKAFYEDLRGIVASPLYGRLDPSGVAEMLHRVDMRRDEVIREAAGLPPIDLPEAPKVGKRPRVLPSYVAALTAVGVPQPSPLPPWRKSWPNDSLGSPPTLVPTTAASATVSPPSSAVAQGPPSSSGAAASTPPPSSTAAAASTQQQPASIATAASTPPPSSTAPAASKALPPAEAVASAPVPPSEAAASPPLTPAEAAASAPSSPPIAGPPLTAATSNEGNLGQARDTVPVPEAPSTTGAPTVLKAELVAVPEDRGAFAPQQLQDPAPAESPVSRGRGGRVVETATGAPGKGDGAMIRKATSSKASYVDENKAAFLGELSCSARAFFCLEIKVDKENDENDLLRKQILEFWRDGRHFVKDLVEAAASGSTLAGEKIDDPVSWLRTAVSNQSNFRVTSISSQPHSLQEDDRLAEEGAAVRREAKETVPEDEEPPPTMRGRGRATTMKKLPEEKERSPIRRSRGRVTTKDLLTLAAAAAKAAAAAVAQETVTQVEKEAPKMRGISSCRAHEEPAMPVAALAPETTEPPVSSELTPGALDPEPLSPVAEFESSNLEPHSPEYAKEPHSPTSPTREPTSWSFNTEHEAAAEEAVASISVPDEELLPDALPEPSEPSQESPYDSCMDETANLLLGLQRALRSETPERSRIETTYEVSPSPLPPVPVVSKLLIPKARVHANAKVVPPPVKAEPAPSKPRIVSPPRRGVAPAAAHPASMPPPPVPARTSPVKVPPPQWEQVQPKKQETPQAEPIPVPGQVTLLMPQSKARVVPPKPRAASPGAAKAASSGSYGHVIPRIGKASLAKSVVKPAQQTSLSISSGSGGDSSLGSSFASRGAGHRKPEDEDSLLQRAKKAIMSLVGPRAAAGEETPAKRPPLLAPLKGKKPWDDRTEDSNDWQRSTDAKKPMRDLYKTATDRDKIRRSLSPMAKYGRLLGSRKRHRSRSRSRSPKAPTSETKRGPPPAHKRSRRPQKRDRDRPSSPPMSTRKVNLVADEEEAPGMRGGRGASEASDGLRGRGRNRLGRVTEDEEGVHWEEEVDPSVMRGKGRKRAARHVIDEEDDAQWDEEEDPPVMRGRGRKRAARTVIDEEDAQWDEEEDPPVMRGRGRKRAARPVNFPEEEEDIPLTRGRRGASSMESQEEYEDDEAPVKRGRGRRAPRPAYQENQNWWEEPTEPGGGDSKDFYLSLDQDAKDILTKLTQVNRGMAEKIFADAKHNQALENPSAYVTGRASQVLKLERNKSSGGQAAGQPWRKWNSY